MNDAVGSIDEIDFVDGLPELVRHRAPHIVPIGAPIRLRGWALDSQGPSLGDAILVELGDERVITRFSVERPDIADVFKTQALARCGFALALSTTGISPGRHMLSTSLQWRDGDTWQRFAARTLSFANALEPLALEVRPSPSLRGAIDSLFDHDRRRIVRNMTPLVAIAQGAVEVRGWALHDTEPIRSVALRLGAMGTVAGRYGLARRDVSASRDHAESNRCGFSVPIRLDGIAPGNYRLHIHCETASGWLRLSDERTIVVAPATEAFPAVAQKLYEPLPITGTFTDRSVERDRKIGFAATLASGTVGDVYLQLQSRPETIGALLLRIPFDNLTASVAGESAFALELNGDQLPRGRYEANLVATTPDRRAYRQSSKRFTLDVIAAGRVAETESADH